jgi:hypothetical protein
MSAADKTKLDGITAGAAVASVTGTAPISSSGGATPAISISAATTGAAGSMSAADKSKLDGIAAGAQPGTVTGVSGTAPISSSGGATPAISISAATTGAAGSMSAADKSKLDAYPSVSGLTTGQALRATAAGAVGYGALDLANASAVTGTLADARLSSNVPLKSAANTFSAAQTISNTAVDLLTADVTGAHGGSATLKLRKIRGTSIVQNGDYIGAFEGWGYDGAAYRRAGYFAWLVSGAPSSAVMPAAFVIAVNAGAADAGEVARFTSAGIDAVGYKKSGVAGITATVTLAKVTTGGAAGSLTISGGIVTAYTAPS